MERNWPTRGRLDVRPITTYWRGPNAMFLSKPARPRSLIIYNSSEPAPFTITKGRSASGNSPSFNWSDVSRATQCPRRRPLCLENIGSTTRIATNPTA